MPTSVSTVRLSYLTKTLRDKRPQAGDHIPENQLVITDLIGTGVQAVLEFLGCLQNTGPNQPEPARRSANANGIRVNPSSPFIVYIVIASILTDIFILCSTSKSQTRS